VLTAPIVLLIEHLLHRGLHVYVISIAGASIGLVVLLRLAGLLSAIERARGSERLARREAEQAQRLLAFQNEHLRELDLLKDEFVSSVSHELRTPLTSISGYAELLLEEESSETKQGYLRIIERNSARLLGLVSDLLFAARLQDGRLVLDLAPVELRVLVEQAVEEARPRAERAGVVLEVNAGDASVLGEPDRLAQLLDNLVSNAIKFTPAGGRVVVGLESQEGQIRLEVSDTGIGVPPEDRERLFERFFRSQSALEREIQGTGLGLYISKAIVEAHGGRIGVSNVAGGGTVFVVELPGAA
jgi:signal transduction histidine kinase